MLDQTNNYIKKKTHDMKRHEHPCVNDLIF
jgi:hypothetical protein